MNKLVNTCIFLLFTILNLYSQNKIIKGRIIDEDLESLPFAAIYIDNKLEIGKTNEHGYFQIDIPLSINKLLFSFVGYEQTYINLNHNCEELNVIMLYDVTYDFITLKKVDRLRKKRYKNLSKLHKKAFEKGIFKTDVNCYIQDFKPYYIKKYLTCNLFCSSLWTGF